MWALAAYHRAREVEWADFLRTLDTTTPPRLVITDNAAEIGNAVRQVWPAQPGPSFPVPFVKRCEHHLYENARDALTEDRVAHWGSVRMEALSNAFRSLGAGRRSTRSPATPSSPQPGPGPPRTTPSSCPKPELRGFLPDHHSTAALDAHLGTVRDYLDSRSFVLRNQTAPPCSSASSDFTSTAQTTHAATPKLIRASLDANGGHGPRQRRNYDAGTSRRVPRELRQPDSLRA